MLGMGHDLYYRRQSPQDRFGGARYHGVNNMAMVGVSLPTQHVTPGGIARYDTSTQMPLTVRLDTSQPPPQMFGGLLRWRSGAVLLPPRGNAKATFGSS